MGYVMFGKFGMSEQSWCIEYFVDLGIVGPQF